jgi:hypothetical protein
MAQNIIINGTVNAGATIVVKYRISGSSDPYTTITIPAANLPYTISPLPDEDYEVIYQQLCENREESLETTIDPISVCVCTSPVITQGQVDYTQFQLFYNYILGSSYTIYVDEVPIVITNPTGSHIVTGLQPNRTYAVYVVRTLPTGVKCISNLINITTTNVAPCPAVTDLGGDYTSSTALLTWAAAVGAISYNIYVNGSLIGNTTDTDYLITNLTPGQAYIFGVSAICENGYGVLTTTNTTLPVNTECEPPTNLQTVSITDTTIQVSFTPWDVTKATHLYINNVFAIALAAGVTVYNFTGLSPNTSYNITAFTVCDTGGLSPSSTIKTVKTSLSHEPIIFNPSNPTSKSVTVSWNTDPEAVNYTLYKNGIEETTVGNSLEVLYYTFENLVPNTLYSFSVRANYPDAGPVANQNSTTLPVECAKATNLTTTLIGNNRMVISWGLNGQSVSSQSIYVNGVLYATVGASVNSKEIIGLDRNFLYTIYIITLYTNGGLSQSDDLEVSTTDIDPYTGLEFIVDHDVFDFPKYVPNIRFNTHTSVRAYRIRTSELYIIFNDYFDSGELANLEELIDYVVEQNENHFTQYRPMLVEITSYLYNGDTIVNTYWYVFDFTDKPNGLFLSTNDDLPITSVISLLSTSVDLNISNLTSVIPDGHAYTLTAYAMKDDDFDVDHSSIPQLIESVDNVRDITISGLESGRHYYIILRWVDTTDNVSGYGIPIGIITP